MMQSKLFFLHSITKCWHADQKAEGFTSTGREVLEIKNCTFKNHETRVGSTKAVEGTNTDLLQDQRPLQIPETLSLILWLGKKKVSAHKLNHSNRVII